MSDLHIFQNAFDAKNSVNSAVVGPSAVPLIAFALYIRDKDAYTNVVVQGASKQVLPHLISAFDAKHLAPPEVEKYLEKADYQFNQGLEEIFDVMLEEKRPEITRQWVGEISDSLERKIVKGNEEIKDFVKKKTSIGTQVLVNVLCALVPIVLGWTYYMYAWDKKSETEKASAATTIGNAFHGK